MGGSDDPNNIVELTPCQHAMYHFANWQLWKNYKDFCAYKMILGDVKTPEFRRARAKAFQEQIQLGGKIWRENNPEKVKENGIKGNKSQREKFQREGRTIAEQKWIITTPSGEELPVTNLKKFCRENNLLPNKMCEVGKGRSKHHRGYRVRKI